MEMDDYSALAQRVAVSVGDVRGCLILSRDGMVLGAYPEDDETQAKPAWLRFAALGDPERSFVAFPDQVWVFCHRGPYASFAVAEASIRPGLLLDTMEQALLAAEEARTTREPLRLPELNAAPSGKPRTTMHPATVDQNADQKTEVNAGAKRNWPGGRSASNPGGTSGAAPEGAPEAAPEVIETPATELIETAAAEAVEPEVQVSAPTSKEPPTGLHREPQKLAGSAGTPGEEDEDDEGEVDRVMLAKEFSGLLQKDGVDDE